MIAAPTISANPYTGGAPYFTFAGFSMRLSVLAILALCASSLVAYADTIDSYQLNAATAGGGSITGAFSINKTNNSLSTSTLSFVRGSSTTSLPQFGGSGLFGGSPSITFNTAGTPGSASTSLSLIFMGGSVTAPGDVSFAGLTGVCIQSSTTCLSSTISYPGVSQIEANLTSATLVSLGSVTTTPPSVAVTPEPSSFALLGTGLLGVAGMFRKRIA